MKRIYKNTIILALCTCQLSSINNIHANNELSETEVCGIVRIYPPASISTNVLNIYIGGEVHASVFCDNTGTDFGDNTGTETAMFHIASFNTVNKINGLLQINNHAYFLNEGTINIEQDNNNQGQATVVNTGLFINQGTIVVKKNATLQFGKLHNYTLSDHHWDITNDKNMFFNGILNGFTKSTYGTNIKYYEYTNNIIRYSTSVTAQPIEGIIKFMPGSRIFFLWNHPQINSGIIDFRDFIKIDNNVVTVEDEVNDINALYYLEYYEEK